MSCIAPPRAPRALAAVAATALVAGSGAAWADLTAEGVWQSWQDLATGAGQTLSAEDERRDGDTLTADGVTIVGQLGEADVTAVIDRITFTEAADGTVSVQLSDAYDVAVTGTDGERLELAVAHPGLRLRVAEGAEGLTHTLDAPEVSVAVTDRAGPDMPDRLEFTLSAARVSGVYDVLRDGDAVTNTDLGAGALDLEMGFTDGDDAFDLSYAATGLALRFAGAGMDQGTGMDDGELGAALAAGLAIDLGLTYDTLRYDLTMVEDGEASGAAGGAMDGDLRFVLDASELSFRTASRNGEVTLRGSDLPMPEVTLRAAELSYGLRVPTLGGPEPQPVGAVVRVVEATAPESIWAMADPAGALPRGPVTAIVDLAAQAILPGDLFGTETMMAFMMGGAFEAVQPTAIDLEELVLRAAGAELTGSGSFTLDPTDLATFDGLPRPEGELNLMLRGGNALLDTLVEVGLLPADQANAARMVVALFSRPGDGPDELVSTIEVRDGGAVFANGMRLQ